MLAEIFSHNFHSSGETYYRSWWFITICCIIITIIYGSMSFLIFMIYTLFLHIVPRTKDFDYVIIHGCGLDKDSKVTKLLKDRLDKAIEVYHIDPTPPKLIPSGGQGTDESVSEAEAMRDYLLGQGIPEEDIIVENKSTTKLENLMNSKENNRFISRTQGNSSCLQQLPHLPRAPLLPQDRSQMHRHRKPRRILLLAERADPGIHCHPCRAKACSYIHPGMAS